MLLKLGKNTRNPATQSTLDAKLLQYQQWLMWLRQLHHRDRVAGVDSGPARPILALWERQHILSLIHTSRGSAAGKKRALVKGLCQKLLPSPF